MYVYVYRYIHIRIWKDSASFVFPTAEVAAFHSRVFSAMQKADASKNPRVTSHFQEMRLPVLTQVWPHCRGLEHVHDAAALARHALVGPGVRCAVPFRLDWSSVA